MQPGYFGDAGGPEQYAAAQGWNIYPQQGQLKGSPRQVNVSDSIREGRPTAEIEDRLSRVNNVLERLSNRIDVLDDRLRPVMRADGSGIDCGADSPQEALSPLGDSIRSIEYRVDRACDRLESMLAGLAL